MTEKTRGFCYQCDEEIEVINPAKRSIVQQRHGVYSQCLNCGQEFGPVPWHYFKFYNKGRAQGYMTGLDDGWYQGQMDAEDGSHQHPLFGDLGQTSQMWRDLMTKQMGLTKAMAGRSEPGLAETVQFKRYGNFDPKV